VRSFEVLRVFPSLIEVAVFRNATAGGGDIHVFSTVASYPRPRVAWASDTGEFEPLAGGDDVRPRPRDESEAVPEIGRPPNEPTDRPKLGKV
jgi:hypothetical protein